jgi:hypothetical protein
LKANTWQKTFGAKRRAIDRALLAEAERAIKAEDREADARKAEIARAFGRQWN